MLFATSLLAFVGAGEQPHLTPRKLTLLNSHSNSVIQSLSFPASVLGVYLNRKRCEAGRVMHPVAAAPGRTVVSTHMLRGQHALCCRTADVPHLPPC